MADMQKLRVGVILGGMSSEREVSLNSGRNVFDNLDREAYDPKAIFMDARGGLWIISWQLISQNTTTDITERLKEEARRIPYEALKEEIDFAFISLHGKYGEDGCLQGLLELLRIPYTGPGVLASALGMDKHIQQRILQAAGIGVPESVLVREEEWRKDQAGTTRALRDRFGFPMFTKPPREGSSIGVTLVRDENSLAAGIEEGLKWDRAVLVEELLDGTEFSSIILEEDGAFQALEVTEITPQSEYFTYDDKYMPGRCRKFTPPRNIPPEAVAVIKGEAVRAFTALGFRSYGRIDGFYLKDGRVLITDPNSASGMAPSSFFFEQAACAGMLPSMIIGRLIENALAIHAQKHGPL
ncbi:MAG: D-alanine--D-alanine ligase [Deltaproteobacteria bacterium]|nr:D-alanine--D-alanine ligase [Deltaproteobacteria bacterium]